VNKRLEELARRKQALIVTAANERSEIADACEKIRASFDISQKFSRIGRILKAHPVIATGISSFLVSGLAGKLFKGAGQAVSLLRVALPLWSWWTTRRRSS
jgi:hypothetical protein